MRRPVSKTLDWILVGLCSFSIFLIVPFARSIQKFVGDRLGNIFFLYLVLATVSLVFLAFLARLVFRQRIRRLGQYVWLAVCAGLCSYFAIRRRSSPVETVHFLEYGLLAYLFIRAWRHTIPDQSVYLASLFSGTLVGTIDEILQWIAPDRIWDIRDVGLNALAVVLMLIALRLGIRLVCPAIGIAPRSVRIVSILFGLNLILLALCLSNTPARTAALVDEFPSLAFLEKQEPMSEVIMKHRDPDIGTFFSRLTVEWLKKTDAENAVANGEILRDWKDKDYAEFLSTFQPAWAPFLYEMRVHLYRRDKYFERGSTAADAKERADSFFIAYKENLILKKYFGKTLDATTYVWSPEESAAAASSIDTSRPYESPVGKNSLYWLAEGPMWALVGIILGILALGNLWLWRSRRGISRP